MKIKYLMLLLSIIAFLSCEKPASQEEYGFSLIYMPQAATSGGLNNNYNIPGDDIRNPNYTFDSIGGKLEIILGVYRSGLQQLKSYSVEVYAKNDTTNSLVNDSIIKNSSILPADVYSFPSTVTVENGKRENIFYLSIDISKLNNDYPSLAGRTLVTTIGIQNPSKYELNNSLSKTILLINSGKFMKKP